MTALVIVVAAAVLGKTGEAAPTIVALAGIFEPLAGPIGSTIFALGFFGAAFSSMIANATAGGTMLSDGLGRGASSSSITAKVVSGSILAFGIIVTLLFQASPIQLIVIAQALTIFVAPLLAALILIMANRKSLMGEHAQQVVAERRRHHRTRSRLRPFDPTARLLDRRIDANVRESAAGAHRRPPHSLA